MQPIQLFPAHGAVLSRAVELLFTGDLLSAAEAHRMVLFTRVVPGDALMESALKTARLLARLDSSICRVVRRNIAAASDPVDRILEQEARNQAPIFTDSAFQATVKKMIEKLGTGEDA